MKASCESDAWQQDDNVDDTDIQGFVTYAEYLKMSENGVPSLSDKQLLNMCTVCKDEMILIQKERALEHWNNAVANSQSSKLRELHDSMVSELHRGIVPPAFHALTAKESHYLFPVGTTVSINDANSGKIELSAEKVKMGTCIASQEKRIGEISTRQEKSYLDAFFDKNGSANYEVEDSALMKSWKFDEDYTKTISDLVNAQAEMVGEDVEVTALTGNFPVIEGNTNLITRRLSRGVVSDCFGRSKPKSTYAIVGNPGIGKSWNLIYALQQALIYENVCVLFCFQKTGDALVCIRKNHKIYVWSMSSEIFKRDCLSALLKNSNVLVLLDPKNSGANYSEGNRRMIFAASNNKKHFELKPGNTTVDFPRYLSPQNDVELLISLPYMFMDSNTKVEEIFHYRKIVGNLPRFLLSFSITDVNHNLRMEHITTTIRRLTDNQLDLLVNNPSIAYSDNESSESVSGCIYAISVSLDNKLTDVGYDGHGGVDYGIKQLDVLCNNVLDQIWERGRKLFLSYWGNVDTASSVSMGYKVEDLFWSDLTNKTPS